MTGAAGEGRSARLARLACLALALSLPALAAEPKSAGKKMTIVFTGDNGGEVAPCG